MILADGAASKPAVADDKWGLVVAACLLAAAACGVVGWVIYLGRERLVTKFTAEPRQQSRARLLKDALILAGSWALFNGDFLQALHGSASSDLWWQSVMLIVGVSAYLTGFFFEHYREKKLKNAVTDAALVIADNDRRKRRAHLIQQIVNRKAQRVRRVASRVKTGDPGPTKLSKVFAADEQILMGFAALHAALRDELPDGALRAALFVPSAANSQLEVYASWDGLAGDVITTPAAQHADRYGLGDKMKAGCLATYTAAHGGMHVISDTHNLTEEDKKKFAFFDEAQRQRIRSIVSFGCECDDARPVPVIVVDSSIRGAFVDDGGAKARVLHDIFYDFGTRLLYELAVLKLFTQGSPYGSNSGKGGARGGRGQEDPSASGRRSEAAREGTTVDTTDGLPATVVSGGPEKTVVVTLGEVLKHFSKPPAESDKQKGDA